MCLCCIQYSNPWNCDQWIPVLKEESVFLIALVTFSSTFLKIVKSWLLLNSYFSGNTVLNAAEGILVFKKFND